MEKQISFSEGLVSVPYSDVSPDGQCSELHNLEVHAGCVRPSVLLGKEIQLGGVMKYIHKTGEYIHYLYLATEDDATNPEIKRGTLCYYSQKAGVEEIGVVLDRIKAQEITHISNNGHILIIACKNKELQYIVWDKNKYHYLGFVPDLDINFGLVLEEYDFGERDWQYLADQWTQMGPEDRFNAYVNFVGEWLNGVGNNNKHFILPFFVRAAYRLYDGTYIKLTPPVLMVPNTHGPFITYTTGEDRITGDEVYNFTAHSFKASLEYFASNIPKKWNQIITDVCIFVSQLNSFDYKANESNWGIGSLVSVTENYGYGRTDSTVNFQKRAYSTIDNTAMTLHLDNDLNVRSKIDTAVFREFKRIPIQSVKDSEVLAFDANSNMEKVETSGNILYDNDNGLDSIIPNGLFTFNKRLNLYNLDIKEFVGDKVVKSVQKLSNTTGTCNVYARLQRYGTETEVVLIQSDVSYNKLNEIYYYYVHHRNAVGLIIEKEIDGVLKYDELTLEKCLGLNGSYFYDKDGYEPIFSTNVDYTVSGTLEEIYGNYLYTSKDNNPFVFPPKGRNIIGGGTIIGLNTATKPLSEGQVGDFPLIVFCDDGNYALSIIKSGEDAGLYEGNTPVRPDVAVNRNIEATEEGILFVSNQGLMLMGRNEATLLSKKLDGANDDFRQTFMIPETANEARENVGEDMEPVGQTGQISYRSESSLVGDWAVVCSTRLVKGNVYKLTLSCDTLYGGRGGDYYVSVKVGDNIIIENHLIRKSLEIEWVSTITGENQNISIKLTFTASGQGLKNEHVIDYQMLLVKDNQEQGGGDEPVIPDEGDEGDDEEEYYDDGFDTMVTQRFEDFTPRKFIESCKPLLDYSNKRIFLIGIGFNKGYVLNYEDGTFGTIDFGEYVRNSTNSYPYGYIQFESNKVVVLDDDYNFGETMHPDGVIVTRPVKMDSLLLKRITEFALQGNFEENQKITLWGSNDLKRWFSLGTTERRRVGAMRGYYFKYWRFTIQTCLKENEDISGLLVKYSVKDDGRFR